MATNNVVNAFKKLTIEERAEIKEKFADVSTYLRCDTCNAYQFNIFILCNQTIAMHIGDLSVTNILICYSYYSLY